jgi:uncharacterized NAD(P)/FAD-binding protein YdhS
MKKITIIGSGASGTLLAINLIKHNDNQPIEINLVEKKGRLGRGVAYSTATDYHLLNVPANKMGAFPDDLEHFYRWITAKDYDFFPSDFVPRKFYGEYLRETLSEALKNKSPNVSVNILDDEAVDIMVDDTRAQVILNSGEVLYSDKVILAFGNFLPPHPRSENQSFTKSEKYFQNPWSAIIHHKIEPSDDVFIIGSGLTAIDTVLSLKNKKHTGKIFLFSTRGLLPTVHKLGYVYPSFEEELKSQTRITDLLKIVRRHIEKAEKQNSDWRAVIDSLRPHTQAIWLNLPLAEKRYFMQHLSRYWNVARHRMPPECAEILDELQEANQLQILKGRLKNIETNGKFNVIFTNDGEEKNLSVDAIVNCIGSEGDFTKVDFPLVKNLVERGLIKTDVLKLGIDATPDGKTIDKSGTVSDKIFTIGPALRGVLWESTAMPEIRAQTNKLALSLLNGGQH